MADWIFTTCNVIFGIHIQIGKKNFKKIEKNENLHFSISRNVNFKMLQKGVFWTLTINTRWTWHTDKTVSHFYFHSKCYLRLGLHVVIFSVSICGRFTEEWDRIETNGAVSTRSAVIFSPPILAENGQLIHVKSQWYMWLLGVEHTGLDRAMPMFHMEEWNSV